MADTELKEIQELCIEKLYVCTDNVLKYLDDDKEEELLKLKSNLKKYCLHEAYPGVIEQALENIKNESDPSNVDGIKETLKFCIKSTVNKINVKNHPWVVELDNRIKQGNRAAENLDKSDLAITSTNNTFIDPITKRPIEDPVRNTHCGHIYDRESILNHINIRKNKTLCPVVGCGNKHIIVPEHLINDHNTRCHITQQSTMNEVTIHNIDMDSE